MSNIAKGGRGKRAPYKSTHYRFPVPLKPTVEQMAANYRELVTEYSDPEDPALIAAVINALTPSGSNLLKEQQQVNEAIAILEEALKLKANAGGAIKDHIREALINLLINPA